MSKLERAWYRGHPFLWLLWPFSMLFAAVTACRRYLFATGFIASSKPDAFLVIVGNISVGGNGKTPVVIALVEHFRAKGLKVGVLSRGYGGRAQHFPHHVMHADSAALVGDEPRLIASRTGVDVVIDPLRRRGAEFLVSRFGCQVIVCDDGLQHYALKRDVELVVMDERRYGNGKLLPMGPLREGIWRLDTVDMILHNVKCAEDARLLSVTIPQFHMQLRSSCIINVKDPALTLGIEDFIARYPSVNAIAGIGNPQRFFTQLSSAGVNVLKKREFADHHTFVKDDIPIGPVIMTEKDAVKVNYFAHEECWYLAVNAVLPDAFYNELNTRLEASGWLNKGRSNGV
ncbi:tetraacyldisaccharide 4'-kinase [Alteromonas pelagimontana]|uniref:Tetraacyldisaccharide 4'-kinase n=1 Tax=Alteromonas pelagimontana TaxID=1858656 RepID=A0A6M4MHL1_9ALTE|nr:tetraacyldisaccharide 4'-kinase [Alteromonas pelagimontana]QJR82502.1 tetraacyldisaccharide 4'-kinase [Alteromonas pelagimontana]